MPATRRATPKQIVAEGGPYTGMDDSLDPTAAQEGLANLLQNVYPLEAEVGEALVGRPGYLSMGAAAIVAGHTPQGFHQFTKLDGTEKTVAAANGQLWYYDWGNQAWVSAVSAGVLSVAGVTIAPTARVSFVTFANKLIGSDGVNTAFAWDGTINGGLTTLTNAPVFYGPLTVYADKLFGIKATDRATFVWSEENDPTVGYQATVAGFTFADSWTIGQTDQNSLVAMRGTNAALYYWRERSTGAVYGKVNTDFVTTATHDALSTSVGTKSPWGIVQHGEGFLFPDADGRPHRLIPGGTTTTGTTSPGVAPVWQPFRETLKTIPRANLVDALAIDFPAARLMLIGYTELLQTLPSAWLVYRDTSDGFKAAGIWRGWLTTAAALVKDGSGAPTFIHGATDGFAYKHGNPDGSTWDDFAAGGTAAITHIVQGMPLASDPPSDAQFQRLDLWTRTESTLSLLLDYETPRGRSSALSLVVNPPPGLNQFWDVALWDQFQWSAGAVEVHSTVGWNGNGRWIKPRITHATVGERFGFVKWRVTGATAGDSPFVP